jgi:hypothetical protein
MNISRIYRLAFLAVTFSAATVVAEEANKMKIKRSDLPPAVAKTVAQSRGATFAAFQRKRTRGKLIMELS